MRKLNFKFVTIAYSMLIVLVFISIKSEFKTPLSANKVLKPYAVGDKDDPQARMNQEFKMLRDVSTNIIPDNIYNLEQDFASKLPKVTDWDNPNSLVWVERGPNNVGGRTRALAADITNPNIFLAGGVSGGMWRSVNSGASWTITTTNLQLHSATCISQDKKTGNTSKWYVGTGERSGNSAGQFGQAGAFTGNGIYKSTDNGLSWNLLPSTSGIPPSSFSSDWQYVWNIATDASNTTQDEVYAATIGSIYRSTNGGTNWAQVLGSSTTRSAFTDVTVAPGGVVYAAGSYIAGGTMNGIWRTTDGTNWVDITPTSNFPAAYGRVVISYAPSNPNVLYVAIQGVPAGEPNSVNKHQLWKYTYISGNGTGTGGIWENRGANLPQAGQNNYGNHNEPFDTQDGYDLWLCVKPDNENALILNAVNMYYSTDAFATSTNAKRIGGYLPGQENEEYPAHHPDVHSGFFKPGSTIEFISGHDGGLSRTADITTNITTSNPVTWQSLNNGYNVTQFYGISIAPESGNNRLAGGFQDNGSFAANSGLLSTPWTTINSGDGGFCSISPATDNRIYSSTQNGGLNRINFDGTNGKDIKPFGSKHQLFINPHTLDQNNSSLLYYAGGNSTTTTGIWRNNNVKNADTITGWSYLAGTDLGSADAQVSAIGISKANNANVIYYGTEEGHVRKITNAEGTPVVSGNLNTGLPTGYVSCIAVDPLNSEKALLVFSNYNIHSLWFTENGGTNWTSVEGNLYGANGPSVRWAEIFYINSTLQIVLATSTGIYYTNALNGASTVWTQEAVNSIGNVVCVHMDFRSSDNTLVVGTHGRGSFQTQITEPISVQLISSEVPQKFSLSQNYPNPFNPSTKIVFNLPENSKVSLKIFDIMGREVSCLISNEYKNAGSYSLNFDGSNLPSGVYFYQFITEKYTVVKKMTLLK